MLASLFLVPVLFFSSLFSLAAVVIVINVVAYAAVETDVAAAAAVVVGWFQKFSQTLTSCFSPPHPPPYPLLSRPKNERKK